MIKLKSENIAGRPHFFDDPAVDELAAMLLALVSEVAVLGDRLDTVERVLAAGGALDRAAVEAYRPDETVRSERKALHQAYLGRIFRILKAQTEAGSELVPFDKMDEFETLMARARGGQKAQTGTD
jgi:hypothetical protein